MSLREVYELLYRAHGPQSWWPAKTPFEVMVGAVLTQNTAWTNVEKAIANLHAAEVMEAERLLAVPVAQLAEWLRPAGYFNVKAQRLRNFCAWYVAAGGYAGLRRQETGRLREELLSVKGIGPETADDILLYAFHRPVFVIDAYTRRVFSRLGLVSGGETYEQLRARVEQALTPTEPDQKARVTLFNEYHALIVRHGKEVCRTQPRCIQCGLRAHCATPSD